MTYFRKPIDLATTNWNVNGTLNAKIIVALSLPESFLWIRPTQQFVSKQKYWTHHIAVIMEEGVLTKKQTISAFKIIVNQAFVTCYLAKSVWKISVNVNNYKTKLTE